MKKLTEGQVHVLMRAILRDKGFELIAGEFPGGSDHELFPLNVIDPTVARDSSPDPRRHSAGESIPDIVALRSRFLILGEAKLDYHEGDRQKLLELMTIRRKHLLLALKKFAVERRSSLLLPVETLTFLPTLIFTNRKSAPAVPEGFSYLILSPQGEAQMVGPLSEAATR